MSSASSSVFLSTPSARRATSAKFRLSPSLKNFYPRPPRGGRLTPQPKMTVKADFYPRPPRGGRRREVRIFQRWYQISIHALREEGDKIAKVDGTAIKISIHALREEGDVWAADCEKVVIEFLSTPSARRATGRTVFRARNRWISIHALREEGDRPSQTCCSCSANFYPRPPRGGRPII